MSELDSRSDLDYLTGLPGVQTFLQESYRHAEEEYAAGMFPLKSAVCFDINNFKLYNSLHGNEKGDQCLRQAAEILKSVFRGELVCRSGGDTFLTMAERGAAVAKVEDACCRIDGLLNHPNIRARAGITQVVDKDLIEKIRKNKAYFFDQARIACDSIRGKTDCTWVYYSPEMDKNHRDRVFILSHFDEALKNGTIQVYFQPVVRSLTGKFCNSEALSRWIDPEYGFISPATFIPVLEEARLIHKLDLYVLREAARILRYEIDHEIPYVQISVNFSRMDFVLMDPFAETEKIIEEFKIPRKLISIEITETALLEEKSVLAAEIDKFRSAGYDVWLDDFGTGYSSLNVLADFNLDEIKLDIEFLRNYSESKKKVIQAIVMMAKTLGLHTLAEGVETKDQADFLTAIGCDKQQGYYYAKPMPFRSAVPYPEQRKISVETQKEEQFLNAAKVVNVITEKPLAVYVYNGQYLTILYANDSFSRNLELIGFHTLEDVNRTLRDPDKKQNGSLYDLAELAKKKGSGALIDKFNEKYMHLSVEKISETEDLVMFLVNMEELNMKHTQLEFSHFGREMKNFKKIFRGIYYLDQEKKTVEIVQSYLPGYDPGDVISNPAQLISSYSEQSIHPRDRKRYLEFMEPGSIYRLAESSEHSEAVTMFREKGADGSYHWMIYDAVVLNDTKSKDILLAIRDDVVQGMVDSEEILAEYALSQESD
ncbi:MAG: EAL domain-containing protein [Eubacterium sp.]|nr:EAL domain-containing protein [Eubacterium sp.]